MRTRLREPATRPMQGTAGWLPVLAVLLLAAHVRGIPLQWESIQPVGLRCVGLRCKWSRVLRACVSSPATSPVTGPAASLSWTVCLTVCALAARMRASATRLW